MTRGADQATPMSQCLVSFGSNLGTRESAIAQAARDMAGRSRVANFRASRLFETPPIGGPSGQEPFLNGVAAFDTDADACEVLGWLQDLEDRLGRLRKQRWGARAIDLDVVLHGNLIGGASDLTVPHPRYTARRFVLRPACDVAAEYRDPRFGWSIGRLARHLDAGNASMALVGCDAATRRDLCQRLRSRFGLLTFEECPLPGPMSVIANAPSLAERVAVPQGDTERGSGEGEPGRVRVLDDAPWVSAFVPDLPTQAGNSGSPTGPGGRIDEECQQRSVPRLIARMQWTREEDRWPAPHRIWPCTSGWPEYRLEVDDLDWAAGEIKSALDSMRCAIMPVTEDGNWW